MRRGPLIAAVAVVVLTALLAVVTNWATEVVPVPAWLADPTVIVLVGVVLVLLLVVVAVIGGRPPESAPKADVPTFATVAPSLRPPPPGAVFGRDAELAALAVPHQEPVLDVLCAGGGTGKTTLAREVARRHGRRSFWIDWRNDPDVLATSMVEVARTLGLPAEQVAQAQRTGASLPDLVWGHLESVRGWLVVVDNVDDVDALQAGATRISTYRGWLRPTAAGRLLITTRLQDAELWGPQARLHRIGRLPTADAAAVLRDHAPHGGDAAEELAERLGGHPLALRAAGRAVGAATSAWPTFAAYLAALREQRISVLPDVPRATDPETARRLVGHTWEVSLDQLAAKPETRLARPLLRALSLLARAPIPRGLITPALLPGTPTEQQVDEALAGLNRYGLLEPAAAGTALLHPLVRETSAAFLAKEADVAEWRDRVEDRVVAFVEETVAREREGWADARLLVPHVLGLSGLDLGARDRQSGQLYAAEALADRLHDAAAYDLELELRQQVLDVEIDEHEPHDVAVVLARLPLARVLRQSGNIGEAEEQARRAYEDARAHHPGEVLVTRHVLGATLAAAGRIEEALDHLEAVVRGHSSIDGPEHPNTLTALAQLATAVGENGDPDRAVALHRQVLAARTRTLGPDHRQTLVSLKQLADCLAIRGEHREAAAVLESLLGRAERVIGPWHPGTLASRYSIAAARLHLGERENALGLARRAAADAERVLGADDAITVRTRRLVAECEQALRTSSPTGRLRALLRR